MYLCPRGFESINSKKPYRVLDDLQWAKPQVTPARKQPFSSIQPLDILKQYLQPLYLGC